MAGASVFIHCQRVCLEVSENSQTIYKAAKAGDAASVKDSLAKSAAAKGKLWACTGLDQTKAWEERHPDRPWPGDVNLADPVAGDTPLCIAAFEGHEEAMVVLLQAEGIDVNAEKIFFLAQKLGLKAQKQLSQAQIF